MKPATLARLTEAQSDAVFARQDSAIRIRRGKCPEREARRQHELTRMRTRLTYEAFYRDTIDHTGRITKSVYLGHRAVAAR